MNIYGRPFVSNDLDGLTFPNKYMQEPQLKHEMGLNDGFGFDPCMNEQNMFCQYTNSTNVMGNWAPFNVDEIALHNQLTAATVAAAARKPLPLRRPSLSNPRQQSSGMLSAHMMDNNDSHPSNGVKLPMLNSAASHYGQITPPRSNSSTSEPCKIDEDPGKTASTETATKRRRGKAQAKGPLSPPETTSTPTRARKSSGRKRTSTAQSSSANPADDKRKASLEKNRVAAAKCRINKKEKTEQLQRDSHIKAKENAELRGLVETMESELHTLTAYLSAHSKCADCRNPEQLQEALQILQDQEIRKRFPGLSNGSLSAHSPALSTSGQSMASDFYSQSGLGDSPCTLNPPLPEFNLGADMDMNFMNSPIPD